MASKHSPCNVPITKDAASAIKTEVDAANAMPPPPNPFVPILEAEINGLSVCLKNAVVKTAQIYGFYADTRKLGIEKHAPKPPRSLTASLGREVEKYDQICDSIESHLLQAIAVLQRDLHREEQRLRQEEAAVHDSRAQTISETSTQPVIPDCTSRTADPSQTSLGSSVRTPTNSPPAPGSSVAPTRRQSAISISSLHRPAFPLKLDLSSTALRMSAEEASMFSAGLASPVMLAPRSARPGPNEFPPDLMAAFASATSAGDSLDRHVDIDLTVPEAEQNTAASGVKMTMDPNAGSSADKPIELDLDSIDIDMAITDLFGDSVDTNPTEVNAAVDELFSPVVEDSSIVGTVDETIVKSEKPDENFLDALGVGESSHDEDIFASLTTDTDSSRSQPPKEAVSAAHSVPSPATLLANFHSSPHLQSNDTSSSTGLSNSDTPFDLNSIDLSHLGAGFFGSNTESGMDFSMNMEEFLDMGGVSEEKDDSITTKVEPS